MKKVTICVMIALSLLGQVTALGQNIVARAEKLEKALKAKDAKRKLKETINGGHYVHQDWTVDSQKVSVVINEYSSPEEASRMKKLAERGVSSIEVRGEMHGVGDECVYFTDRRGTRTSLILRKGNVIVDIDATSLAVAKKFARDIADHLDGK